jgi:hypothetical protein
MEQASTEFSFRSNRSVKARIHQGVLQSFGKGGEKMREEKGRREGWCRSEGEVNEKRKGDGANRKKRQLRR